MNPELSLVLIFVLTWAALLSGLPVGIALGSMPLLVLAVVWWTGGIAGADLLILSALPDRFFDGVLLNQTLLAIPLFILMGALLQQTGLVEAALGRMTKTRAGAAPAVVGAGSLLGATSGVVGASVSSLAVLSWPSLQRQGFSPSQSSGLVAASGALGQIIPPSLVLLILADQVGAAYNAAQFSMGNFAPDLVTAGHLFAASLLPGLLLAGLYAVWSLKYGRTGSESSKAPFDNSSGGFSIVILLALAAFILGAIILGFIPTTEAALLGCITAFLLLCTFKPKRVLTRLNKAFAESLRLTALIYFILLGALIFSLSLKVLGGEVLIRVWILDLVAMTGGHQDQVILAMVLLMIFLLGFFFDFLEILLVLMPAIGGLLFATDLNPIWVAVLMAMALQTSFLTPPFGLALFYLKAARPELTPLQLYRGVWPYVLMQLTVLALVWLFPTLATALPIWLLGR